MEKVQLHWLTNFDVPSNPLELDALMQAHCTEVGPVNISSETQTVEFESLSMQLMLGRAVMMQVHSREDKPKKSPR